MDQEVGAEKGRREDEKGAVLMVTLWILAILALLAIGIGFRTAIELKLVSYQIDTLKANEIAKAGIRHAINELRKDNTLDLDTLWECGIKKLESDETVEGRFKSIKVGEGHFDISYEYYDENNSKKIIYGIEDLQGKININRASKAALKGLSDRITDEIAENIMAWRGDPEPALSDNKDYADKEYECKTALFNIPEELLLVRGIAESPEIFYGQEEELGIRDVVTVYGPEGFDVNVNTAGYRALRALGFDDSGGLGDSAEVISRNRSGDDGDITQIADNLSFSDLSDLIGPEGLLTSAKGEGIDIKDLSLKGNPVFNSSYFRIRSTGVLEGKKSSIEKTITCVVQRESLDKINILNWLEE